MVDDLDKSTSLDGDAGPRRSTWLLGTFVRRGIRGLVFILAGSITLAGCGRPSIVNSSELLSPDLRWTATLEHVDNGLGQRGRRLPTESALD